MVRITCIGWNAGIRFYDDGVPTLASMTVDRGAGLKGLWSKFKAKSTFAGGFLWAYVDEAVRRTDTDKWTLTVLMSDGIVGGKSRKEGSFILFGRYGHPFKYIH